MDPFQIFAMGITLAHLALLAGVFFGSSLRTHAYVSTEVHGMIFFRTFLTLIVLTETVLCATYIYVQSGPALRVSTGVTFAGLSVIGWALVASFPTQTTEHLAGAVLFTASTALYSIYFIEKAKSLKVLLYGLWATSSAAAIAFCVLYFVQFYNDAAILEWTAFMLDAATLFIFFYSNPPSSLDPQGRLQTMARQDDTLTLLVRPVTQDDW